MTFETMNKKVQLSTWFTHEQPALFSFSSHIHNKSMMAERHDTAVEVTMFFNGPVPCVQNTIWRSWKTTFGLTSSRCLRSAGTGRSWGTPAPAISGWHSSLQYGISLWLPPSCQTPEWTSRGRTAVNDPSFLSRQDVASDMFKKMLIKSASDKQVTTSWNICIFPSNRRLEGANDLHPICKSVSMHCLTARGSSMATQAHIHMWGMYSLPGPRWEFCQSNDSAPFPGESPLVGFLQQEKDFDDSDQIFFFFCLGLSSLFFTI